MEPDIRSRVVDDPINTANAGAPLLSRRALLRVTAATAIVGAVLAARFARYPLGAGRNPDDPFSGGQTLLETGGPIERPSEIPVIVGGDIPPRGVYVQPKDTFNVVVTFVPPQWYSKESIVQDFGFGVIDVKPEGVLTLYNYGNDRVVELSPGDYGIVNAEAYFMQASGVMHPYYVRGLRVFEYAGQDSKRRPWLFPPRTKSQDPLNA